MWHFPALLRDRLRSQLQGKYTNSPRLMRRHLRNMKQEHDKAESTLSETMAARIEIEDLGDPAHQKKMIDAVEALDGVIEIK